MNRWWAVTRFVWSDGGKVRDTSVEIAGLREENRRCRRLLAIRSVLQANSETSYGGKATSWIFGEPGTYS
jgi:hypothetical protein